MASIKTNSIVVKIEEYLDSTYLKLPEEAGISIEEAEVVINKIIEEGIASNFACVMIRPNFVSKAVERIQTSKSKLKVGTVIDFPFGNSSTEKKIEEAEEAISNGAYDIDFVCDYNSFKRGSFVKFDADIIEGTKICVENKKITKWIIETGALSKDEIRNISKRITKLIQSHFPTFVKNVYIKTSTGYYGGYGATVKDVKVIKSVSGNLKIKASGGISNLKDALAMLEAGADRIGTSKAVDIFNEKEKQVK
ncbi:deoxyribose-phosphate aldolase [Flavobacteriales bacterium]|nr:deoxyribose-phosphate aldolase [Flavobacteriales bacterium]